MQARYRISFAAVLFLGCSSAEAAQTDSDPNVVFSLKEWAHWAPVVGADDPAFTLYDNRDLIYYNMDAYRYECVQLTGAEYTRLTEEVIPKDLATLQDFYLRIYATCQNEYYFYFGGELQRKITVYGHPTANDMWYSYDVPLSIRRCFNMISGYRHSRAEPWFPEKFEVLAWETFPTNQELPRWPADWPDLHSPDTIARPYTPTVYSIFLPSELFDEFIALGDSSKGAALINGRQMAIWYRMPIPGEEVFSLEFDEPDHENMPLHQAVLEWRRVVVESLLAGGADIDAARADGGTALHLAVQKGYESLVQLLIDSGADIEALTSYGNTPLLCALDVVQVDLAELLLSRGADPNLANSKGDTALHYTTDDRMRDIAETLVVRGLDLEAKNDANDTPLYCAVRDGALAVAELLMTMGADVNAAKSDGRTALHIAASHNHKEAVELLLSAGADLSAQTNEGHTPLDYALIAGRDEIAEVRRAAGTESGSEDEQVP